MAVIYKKRWKNSQTLKKKHAFCFMVAMATEMKQYYQLWYQMIRNKILGKVTKFVKKWTKTLGVANGFMVGGHIGLYRVNGTTL